MKICWMSDWNRWGNGKGYTVHNTMMRTWSERIGVQITDLPTEADVVLDIVVPTGYKPVPGKFNILFTMYEMATLPDEWIEPVNKADLLIVPCEQNKRLFRQYTKRPIEVCKEGIDPAEYQFRERDPGRMVESRRGVKYRAMPENRHFNFLWVGASNPRKGYEIVTMAWEEWLKREPQEVVQNTRLIMKSTKETEAERVGSMFGCIIDLRKLPLEDLINLYYESHAFLLPSMGEGWGLTLCEAQATGLPCIYTPWSGPVDFMRPEWSYPAKFAMRPMRAMKQTEDGPKPYHTGIVAQADPKSVYRRMAQIYYGYETALAKGKRGSDWIQGNFTWELAARRLAEIIGKYTGQTLEASAA